MNPSLNNLIAHPTVALVCCILLLLSACAGGGSGPADSSLPFWVPEEPRHPERLVLVDDSVSDPLEWWRVNILSQVSAALYQDDERTQLASDIVAVTNATRARYGLAPVERLSGLDEVAQAHAQDEAVRDYWSHKTPEGLGSRQRVQAAGVGTVISGGENSSTDAKLRPSAERIVNGWENHTGHRELLLSPGVKYIGVGIHHYPGDEYGHYIQLLVDFEAPPLS